MNGGRERLDFYGSSIGKTPAATQINPKQDSKKGGGHILGRLTARSGGEDISG